MRLALAAVLAGSALLAPAATAAQDPCTVTHPCYDCVMYPCYPSDYPPFLVERATYLCRTAVQDCPI